MIPAAAGPFETLRQRYEAAFKAGDASAVAALYTDNAVLMPPDASSVTGARGIKGYYEALFHRFTINQTISTEERAKLGDWVAGRGGYTAVLTPRGGGEAVHIEGKWMNIFAAQSDGSWKIARQIWNVSTAPIEPKRWRHVSVLSQDIFCE